MGVGWDDETATGLFFTGSFVGSFDVAEERGVGVETSISVTANELVTRGRGD